MSSDVVLFDIDELEELPEPEAAPVARKEIPEYYRIKTPTRDEFMSIKCIYDGREEEHYERGESENRWLIDERGVSYRFQTVEEARVFLALRVDPKYIRENDRPRSIKAYAIKKKSYDDED